MYKVLNLVLGVLLIAAITGCKDEGELTFQDNFDYYDLGSTPRLPWTKEGLGMARIDTTRSHSGIQSMYFETGSTFDSMVFISLSETPVFPFPYNRITGELYIWLEANKADSISLPAEWTIIQASGPVRDQDYLSELSVGGQGANMTTNFDTWSKNTDCWRSSTTHLPTNEWVKISWQFDGMQQTSKVWVNDLLIESLSKTDSTQRCLGDDLKGEWKYPVFEELMIGWVSYDSISPKRRFWVDDVIFYQ